MERAILQAANSSCRGLARTWLLLKTWFLRKTQVLCKTCFCGKDGLEAKVWDMRRGASRWQTTKATKTTATPPPPPPPPQQQQQEQEQEQERNNHRSDSKTCKIKPVLTVERGVGRVQPSTTYRRERR